MALGVNVQKNAVSTSGTGTTTITDSGFGTPDVILSMASRHDSGTADETAVDGASLSVGLATDATDEWCAGSSSQHDDSKQDSDANWRGQGGFYTVPDNLGALRLHGHIDAMVTDGVRVINELNTDALAANLITTFLNGSDIANHGIVRTEFTNPAGDFSFEFGFEPDLIICMFMRHRTFSTSWQTTSDARLHIGFATNGDITGGADQQASFAIGQCDTGANAAEPQQSVRSDAVAFIIKEAGDDRGFDIALKNFSASSPNGVVLTSTAGSETNETGDMVMLGIKFANNAEPRLVIRGMPTSTGSDTYSSVGVDPDWAWVVTTAMAAGDIDTIVLDQKAGRLGMSFLEKTGAIAKGATFIEEDASADMDTECTTHSLANFLPEHTGGVTAGATVDADFTSFGTGNFVRNFQKVISGYAAQEIILFIGQAAVGDDHTIIPSGAASVVVAAAGTVDVELVSQGAATITVAANATITQGHVLVAQGAASITVAANCVVDVEILPAGAATLPVAANAIVDVEVKPAGAVTLPVAANVTITQGHVLAAQGAAGIIVAASGSIFPDITSQGAAVVTVAANGVVVQNHILDAQGAASVTVAASGSIFPDVTSQGAATLPVAANASITQGHVLTAQGAASISVAANGIVDVEILPVGAAAVTVAANGVIDVELVPAGAAALPVAANGSITPGVAADLIISQGAACILVAASGTVFEEADSLSYFVPNAVTRDRTPTFAVVSRTPLALSPTRIP